MLKAGTLVPHNQRWRQPSPAGCEANHVMGVSFSCVLVGKVWFSHLSFIKISQSRGKQLGLLAFHILHECHFTPVMTFLTLHSFSLSLSEWLLCLKREVCKLSAKWLLKPERFFRPWATSPHWAPSRTAGQAGQRKLYAELPLSLAQPRSHAGHFLPLRPLVRGSQLDSALRASEGSMPVFTLHQTHLSRLWQNLVLGWFLLCVCD